MTGTPVGPSPPKAPKLVKTLPFGRKVALSRASAGGDAVDAGADMVRKSIVVKSSYTVNV